MTTVDVLADPSPPQVRLMEAAEHLVARLGFDGASSRAITRAAGHRNNSAIAYHFGSRRALLDAVWRWRSGPIDAHRRRLVAEIVEQGRDQDPEALMRALVVPSVTAIDALRPSSWARYTVATLSVRPLDFVEAADPGDDGVAVPPPATRDLLDLMRSAVTDEPGAASLRVALVSRSLASTLASWEADVERGEPDVVPLGTLAERAVALGATVLAA